MHYPVGYNRSLMIILLVTYIIQVGRCASEDGSSPAPDSTIGDTKPTTASGTNAADQSPPTEDGKPSMFSKSKTELFKSLSTLGDGLGLVLKAVGQVALTGMGVLFGTYNGAISVVAKAGETVSTGLNLVNNVTQKVVLVRDLTGGVSNLASGISTTFRENTKTTIANREKLFDTMDEKLENHHPESLKSAPANGGSADGKPTDTTTPAAAPPATTTPS